jgi:hypothetical protein
MFSPGTFFRPAGNVFTTLSMALLSAAVWTANSAIQPGNYEITTQIVMPHLEKSLRYATTRDRRCFSTHRGNAARRMRCSAANDHIQ